MQCSVGPGRPIDTGHAIVCACAESRLVETTALVTARTPGEDGQSSRVSEHSHQIRSDLQICRWVAGSGSPCCRPISELRGLQMALCFPEHRESREGGCVCSRSKDRAGTGPTGSLWSRGASADVRLLRPEPCWWGLGLGLRDGRGPPGVLETDPTFQGLVRDGRLGKVVAVRPRENS